MSPQRSKQGIFTLTSISLGLAFAASCFPLLASTVSSLGLWSIAAIFSCGVLVWLVSRVYAELSGLYPSSAGIRTYVGQAFGHRQGLWLSILYLFLVVALGASETYILSEVLAALWPSLSPVPVALGFVVLCALINVLGIELTGRIQAILTYSMFTALCSLSILFILNSEQSIAPKSLDFSALSIGLPGAVFLFVGFEWVVSAIENNRQSSQDLPKAMTRSLVFMTFIYSILALAFLHSLTPTELAHNATPHLTLGLHGAGQIGLIAMAILSILATMTSFNSGILGASRLVYALAREGSLPRPLAKLQSRFLTPWLAILTISTVTAISAVTLASSKAVELPILIGGSIECFVFGIVTLSFAKLRNSQASRLRPYRAPFGRKTAAVLATLFFLLSGGCLLATKEWAVVAGLVLSNIMLVTGVYSFVITRSKGQKSVNQQSIKTKRLVEARHG